VTPPRFDDTSPAFTLDGKYLAFLSNRAFVPVYDAHHWDLGFLPGVRPHPLTCPLRAVGVVLLGEGVQEGLELGEGGGLARLGAEPFLEGLLESLDFPLGSGGGSGARSSA
jgi:tricorn protease